MIDNSLNVAIGEVFAFYDLDLPLVTTCEIFNEFPMYVEGVPYRLDEVWFVMFVSMFWVKDVVRYSLGVVRVL